MSAAARWVLMVLVAAGCATTPRQAAVAEQAAPPEPSPAEVYAQAVAELEAGKLAEADARLAALVARVPTSPRAYTARGLVRERLKDRPGAAAAYEAAIRLDPAHLPTVLALGRVYRELGRPADARTLYQRTLDGQKEPPVELLAELAATLRMLGALDEAEAACRKALARDPEAKHVHHTLALIALDRDQPRLAEQIAVVARTLAPQDPAVANTQGLIALAQKELPVAMAHFERAVAMAPSFAPARYNLGAMALAARDFHAAREHLEAAARLEPDSVQTLVAYAQAVDGLKGEDPVKGVEAGALFEKALSLREGLPEAICGAAWAYSADRSGWEKALRFFERCKALGETPEPERARIDAKVKGLVAMQSAKPPPAPKAAPAAAPAGESVVDRVSDAAEKEASEAPAEPAP